MLQPSWSSWLESVGVVWHPTFLRQPAQTAVVIGSLLFRIDPHFPPDMRREESRRGRHECLRHKSGQLAGYRGYLDQRGRRLAWRHFASTIGGYLWRREGGEPPGNTWPAGGSARRTDFIERFPRGRADEHETRLRRFRFAASHVHLQNVSPVIDLAFVETVFPAILPDRHPAPLSFAHEAPPSFPSRRHSRLLAR